MKTIKMAMVALGLVAGTFISSYGGSASKDGAVELSSNNAIVINGPITGETIGTIIEKARDLDHKVSLRGRMMQKLGLKSKAPIYLIMFTPGGEIQSGLELLETLKGLDRPVNTITIFAASMGFQVVQQLGDRLIMQNGILMSHHAVGSFEGEFGGKYPSQAESRKRFWEQRLLEMDQQTVNRTNGKQTLKSYQEAYDHELWLTGSQAVEQGYADRVVRVKCDDSLSGVTTYTAMFMGMIPVDYDMSNCPLNMTPMNIRIHVDTNHGDQTLDQFKSAGGEFGVACLQAAVIDPTKVCAINTTLTIDKLYQVKAQFIDRFVNVKNYVIPIAVK